MPPRNRMPSKSASAARRDTARKDTSRKGTGRNSSASNTSSDKPRMSVREHINDWKSRPLFDYHLLLIVVGLLTGIGLVMVLSASMALNASSSSFSVFGTFLRQLVMVIVGLVVFWLVLRTRIETIRKWALPLLLVSVALLVLVAIPGIGVGLEETGARSWLMIAGVTLQPSELAKIALALWGSKILADRTRNATNVRELFGLFAFASVVVLVLVLIQRDVGMVASMSVVVVALAWFAGLPRWIVGFAIGFFGMVIVGFSVAASFRSARFRVYFDSLFGRFNDVRGDAYQSYQGFLSLAEGSMTGVGVGQSSAKWFYLPEASNDFIFAIIGEELGFIGAGIVILLYAALGWVGLRIASKQADPFLRLLAATVTTATVVQAFVNIGYVVGLLPVTGLQLPLISSGGTSAIVTLMAMGLLATCARNEPEAISAMQTSGRPGIDRILGIPEPTEYRPEQRYAEELRSQREPQRFDDPDKYHAGSRANRDRGYRNPRDLRDSRDFRDSRSPRDSHVQRMSRPTSYRRSSRDWPER